MRQGVRRASQLNVWIAAWLPRRADRRPHLVDQIIVRRKPATIWLADRVIDHPPLDRHHRTVSHNQHGGAAITGPAVDSIGHRLVDSLAVPGDRPWAAGEVAIGSRWTGVANRKGRRTSALPDCPGLLVDQCGDALRLSDAPSAS
jgi:hypothetical protein